MNELHDRIRKSRIDKGLSQAGLAAKTGVSQPTVANWESGSHIPRKGALSRIGDALNVEPKWLLLGDGAQNSNALRNYLKRPIHHIPIFSWPSQESAFSDRSEIGFLPYPTQSPDLFAVAAHQDDTQRRLYIVDPHITQQSSENYYLIQTSEKYTVEKIAPKQEPDKIIGRIIAKLSFY